MKPAPFQVALDNGNRVEGVNEKVPLEEAPGKDFEVHEANGEVRVAIPVCNLIFNPRSETSGSNSPGLLPLDMTLPAVTARPRLVQMQA